MDEQQALKLMADIGPNAKEAIDSWVSLQWYKFIYNDIGQTVVIILFLCFVYRVVMWDHSKNEKDK